MEIAASKVAVDVVIFSIKEGKLQALLIQMKKRPFRGMWAFLGGLVRARESLDAAAARELREKTSVRSAHLEQLYTFVDPDRDPLSRVVSAVYFALLPDPSIKLRTTAKYSNVGWFPITNLPHEAYDHSRLARAALERLRAKLGYTNIAWSLLPRAFTLTELQGVYEIVLGLRLDKRNFRKRILALRLLEPAGAKAGGAHRPAALYSFRSRLPRIVEILP